MKRETILYRAALMEMTAFCAFLQHQKNLKFKLTANKKLVIKLFIGCLKVYTYLYLSFTEYFSMCVHGHPEGKVGGGGGGGVCVKRGQLTQRINH
jgi:hypothetical protein